MTTSLEGFEGSRQEHTIREPSLEVLEGSQLAMPVVMPKCFAEWLSGDGTTCACIIQFVQQV